MANFEHLPDGAIRPRLQLDHHIRILRALWEHTPSAIVPTLSNPVLLVLAEADDGWMDHRRTMADAIATAAPSVRVEWLAGDHDLHIQHAVAVADLLHQSF